MWLLRQAGYSYPEIGLLLGGRDHTTIMHGVAKVEADAGLVAELTNLGRDK